VGEQVTPLTLDDYDGRGSPQTSDSGSILSDPRMPPSGWIPEERAKQLREIAARGIAVRMLPWWRRLRGTLRWWWLCVRSLGRGSR
jgi:hypothetical protein